MWSIILTIALQITKLVLDKIGADKETKEQFLRFIELAANDVKSVKLMEWGQQQLKWLEEHPWNDKRP